MRLCEKTSLLMSVACYVISSVDLCGMAYFG